MPNKHQRDAAAGPHPMALERIVSTLALQDFFRQKSSDCKAVVGGFL